MRVYDASEFQAINHDGRFTPAETECLAWMGEGKDNATIGAIRGHGEPGAKKLVAQVMQKLECHNRTLAVARAFARGYLTARTVAAKTADHPRHLAASLMILFSGLPLGDTDTQDMARTPARTPRITRGVRGGRGHRDLGIDELLELTLDDWQEVA